MLLREGGQYNTQDSEDVTETQAQDGEATGHLPEEGTMEEETVVETTATEGL